jgi:hypothetical protein
MPRHKVDDDWRDEPRDAMAVVDAITAGGGRAIAVKGDVSKAADAGAIIDAAITVFGRLDIPRQPPSFNASSESTNAG